MEHVFTTLDAMASYICTTADNTKPLNVRTNRFLLAKKSIRGPGQWVSLARKLTIRNPELVMAYSED